MYLFQTEALTPSVALPFGFPCLSRAGVPARIMPPPANRRRTEREIGTVDLRIGFPAPRLVVHLPYRWALADGFPALPAGCPVHLGVLYPVLIRGASSAIYVQFAPAAPFMYNLNTRAFLLASVVGLSSTSLMDLGPFGGRSLVGPPVVFLSSLSGQPLSLLWPMWPRYGAQ